MANRIPDSELEQFENAIAQLHRQRINAQILLLFTDDVEHISDLEEIVRDSWRVQAFLHKLLAERRENGRS
jgi:hypothetical protein